MAIRIPIKVFDYNNTTIQGGGPTSVAGGRVIGPFFLPQDTDNVVVKFSASVQSGGASATFQTTDDGGVTWYDVQRTSIISYAGNSVVGGGQDDAEWLNISTISPGAKTASFNIATSVVAVGSVQTSGAGSVYTAIGKAGASTLAQKSVSGLPILSPYNRVFLQYTAAVVSVISERVTVLANNQSATA